MKYLIKVAPFLFLFGACDSSSQITSDSQVYTKNNFIGNWNAQLINHYEVRKKNDEAESLVDHLSKLELTEEVAQDSINFQFFSDSLSISVENQTYNFYYQIDTTGRPKINMVENGQLSILYIEKVKEDTVVLSNNAVSTDQKDEKRFVGSHYLLIKK